MTRPATSQLDARIDTDTAPFRHMIDLLTTLPGVDDGYTAQAIITETFRAARIIAYLAE